MYILAYSKSKSGRFDDIEERSGVSSEALVPPHSCPPKYKGFI